MSIDLAGNAATRRDDVIVRRIEHAAVVGVARGGGDIAVDIGVWHTVATVAVGRRLLAESWRIERQPSIVRRPY